MYLALLENTMVILTSDHGHSICDRGYLGKRGYPSVPEVYEIPLLIRFPKGAHAGLKSDLFVQHHDITAAIFECAAVNPPEPIDGLSFLEDAVAGQRRLRNHVTVGWGATPTVITDRWWFNGKIDGTGIFLYDLQTLDPFEHNLAPDYPEVARNCLKLQTRTHAEAFRDWLIDMAHQEADAAWLQPIGGKEIA